MTARFEQINLNLLVALDAMLAERNVTRAARRQGVTQSAMSRNLAALRTLLDDDLLIRVGNTMQPTAYALSIQDGLRRNLSGLQRLVRTSGPFDPAHAGGTLRVAAPGPVAAIVAPNLVEAIAHNDQGLRLRLEHLDAARVVDAIEDGVDLALGPLLDLGSAVEGVCVHRERFACLVHEDHPAAAHGALDLDSYLEGAHLLISPTGRGDAVVDEALGNRARRVVAEVESFLLAPAIVARTHLILTAPASMLLAAVQGLPVRMVTAPMGLPVLQIAAYWDPTRGADPRVQWLLAQIRRTFTSFRDRSEDAVPKPR